MKETDIRDQPSDRLRAKLSCYDQEFPAVLSTRVESEVDIAQASHVEAHCTQASYSLGYRSNHHLVNGKVKLLNRGKTHLNYEIQDSRHSP